MKKGLTILFIFISVCCTWACSTKSVNNTFETSDDDYIIYDINEPIICFDIADDGKIYYLASVENPKYETRVDDSGEEFLILIFETLLKVLDSDGILENSYIIPDGVNQFCLDNNRIIYTGNSQNSITIKEYDFMAKASKELIEIPDFNNNLNKIELIADKLFFIGINNKYTDKSYTLANSEDNYIYSGERIGCYDLSAGTLSELSVDFPISFSATANNKLLIYAYDEDKGYYFIEF